MCVNCNTLIDLSNVVYVDRVLLIVRYSPKRWIQKLNHQYYPRPFPCYLVLDILVLEIHSIDLFYIHQNDRLNYA